MSVPWRFAASMIVSPAKAEIVSPFSLNSMVSALSTGSFIFIGSPSDLVREVLGHAADRVRRRLAEAADGSVRHRDRELLQELLVPFLRFHELRGLRGAHAARRALAAGFVLEEPHEVQCRVARAVLV